MLRAVGSERRGGGDWDGGGRGDRHGGGGGGGRRLLSCGHLGHLRHHAHRLGCLRLSRGLGLGGLGVGLRDGCFQRGDSGAGLFLRV